MLVYEKKVEGERHLYGTLSSIPSDSDQPLIYKDEDNVVITPTLSDGFKDDGHGGIKDIEQDCKVNVFIGETCIIPPNYVPPTPVETISFKIGNDTYEAEPNMVWDDWLYSDYNTGDFIDGEGVVAKEIEGVINVVVDGTSVEDAVELADTIQNNKQYGLATYPITFLIEDDEYEMEKDMTWAQWIASDYNTDGYKKPELGENIITSDESKCVQLGDTSVKSSDTISEGTKYILVDFQS